MWVGSALAATAKTASGDETSDDGGFDFSDSDDSESGSEASSDGGGDAA